MASTTCELVWLKWLLNDLGFSHLQSTQLYCDNKGTLHIAPNPVLYKKGQNISNWTVTLFEKKASQD